MKYSEKLEHSCIRNAQRLYSLGLDQSKGLRILDIGCGFGYFVHGANQLGHHAVGVNRDDPFFNEVTTMVGIEKVVHTVVAGEPLPKIPGGPFDLITAFATCFDEAGQELQWGVEEWRAFLGDLKRFMAPRCDLYIKFNQYEGGGARSGRDCQAVPDDLLAYFISLGATFEKREMWLRNVQSAV
jgi:SAM-dependent methyltransferase